MYKTIIIEDDADALELIDNFFPKDEFETYLESDWRSACKTIDRISPDLVISDVFLRDSSGFDIVKHIRSSNQKPIVFLITGWTEVEGKSAYDLDVHLFLRKPVDLDEMVAAARSFLRKRPKRLTSASQLSNRELDIIKLIARGMTTVEIGTHLGISHKTVAKHRENMMRRLDAKNVADLVIKSGVHLMI